MDKRLFIQVQGGRKVSGILRGYDIFLNIVLDEATEETNPAQKNQIGQVVSAHSIAASSRVVADRVSFGGVNRSYEGTVYSLWSHSRRLDSKTRGNRRAPVFEACSLSRIVISAFCQAFAYKPSCNKCQTRLVSSDLSPVLTLAVPCSVSMANEHAGHVPV